MRISVRTRPTKRGLEPCSICLGRTRLRVARVLACHELPEQRCYEVDVFDGRCFVIHHGLPGNVWELEAVYGERQRRDTAQTQRRAAAFPAQSDMRQLCFGALGLVLRKIRKAMRSSLTVPATQA